MPDHNIIGPAGVKSGPPRALVPDPLPDWWPEPVTCSDGTVVRYEYRPSPWMADYLASLPEAEARAMYLAAARSVVCGEDRPVDPAEPPPVEPAGSTLAECEAAVERAERLAEYPARGGPEHRAALARLDRARARLSLVREGLPADPTAAAVVLLDELREVAGTVAGLESRRRDGRSP
jgi:hypothetical protein